MESPLPKVLQPLLGEPMIDVVLRHLDSAGFGEPDGNIPIVVVGFGAQLVQSHVGPRAHFVLQEHQLGTGHAALIGVEALSPTSSQVLIVHGDEPLIDGDTYRQMLAMQEMSDAGIVLLTGRVSDTQGLGRVVRDSSGSIVDLVQESELTSSQRLSREINFGAYVFDRSFLERGLSMLSLHATDEYYLPDLVRIASETGVTIGQVDVPHPDEQMGINDKEQLRRAEVFLMQQRNESLTETGPVPA